MVRIVRNSHRHDFRSIPIDLHGGNTLVGLYDAKKHFRERRSCSGSRVIAKELIKALRTRLLAPAGIAAIGQGSRIHGPRKIDGSQFISIGHGTHILSHGWLSCLDEWRGQKFAPRLNIGDNVYMGRYCCITCIAEIIINDCCVLSEHVYISDCSHGLEPDVGPIMDQPLISKGPVHLGRQCFVGYRAAIMPGVLLGDHCVVGANSVVTRSFPSYSMVAGAPARLIKQYSLSAQKWLESKTGCN
jgi:acetyltransferase-like isoleucine patch superfamily enzyme